MRSNAMEIHTFGGAHSNVLKWRSPCKSCYSNIVDHRIAPNKKESQMLSSVPHCSDLVVSGNVVFLEQHVSVDRMIRSGPNFVDLVSSNNMVNTKQTARKVSSSGQGTPAPVSK